MYKVYNIELPTHNHINHVLVLAYHDLIVYLRDVHIHTCKVVNILGTEWKSQMFKCGVPDTLV